MGDFGEATAQAYQFSRADQDAYADRDADPRPQGGRGRRVPGRDRAAHRGRPRAGERIVANDENPLKVSPRRSRRCKPAFRADGTITPASSSANADGAAALILTRRSIAERDGLPILAEIKGHATHSQEPPGSPRRRFRRSASCWTRSAGASATSICSRSTRRSPSWRWRPQRDLGIPRDQLNVNGGACALGHPIGATGARLIVTLLHALERAGPAPRRRSLCIGGGEATAIAIERVVRR